MSNPKVLTEYSNNMQDVYRNIEGYNPGRQCNVLIVFDDMIADIIINKILNKVVTSLFIGGRKLNISTAFITQTYFPLPKDVGLNCARFLLWKFQTKESFNKFQLIHWLIHSFIHSFIHYSADINYKGFMKLYKKFTAKPYSFLVINTSLALDNTLRFKKNFWEKIQKLMKADED